MDKSLAITKTENNIGEAVVAFPPGRALVDQATAHMAKLKLETSELAVAIGQLEALDSAIPADVQQGSIAWAVAMAAWEVCDAKLLAACVLAK